jgi:hypothetical protein
VPTSRHEAFIKRTLITVESLQFTIEQCRRTGFCSAVETPYTVSGLFGIGTYRPVVAVVHAGGVDDVAVEHVRGYHPEGQIGLRSGEPPVPYVFPPSTARNSNVDGVATGYSAVFDFSAALREAIAALPPNPQTYPDQLTAITVLEIGAELGGIAGFHHLFVRVRRGPDPLTRKRV